MVIPQYEPFLGDEEKAQLVSCVDGNWLSSGEKVLEFEKRIADLCQVKHAVSCSNGTLALFMAVKALGIGEGDEVIVPDFTFIASANAVVLAGATPVFCDIDPKTLNINVNDARTRVTPDTKAVMPVHIYGQSADMELVARFAKEFGLSVIEDACQGIGVKWKNKPVGGLSDVGCMSFYADKTITTGEGGMVLTEFDDIADACRCLRNQGRIKAGIYTHEKIGYNFRMTDMQAGVGLAQLGKLEWIIQQKKLNDMLYKTLLAEMPVSFPVIDRRCSNVPFRNSIMGDNIQGLAKHLTDNGIGIRPFFYPLHRQPCFENQPKDFPNSDYAYEHGLSLPSSVKLTREQIEYVCNKIEEFYAN